ncbi:MAG: metal-dependent hydrolase [Thermoplasmatales archaeon]
MVKLTWYGHAAWQIDFSEATVIIDPFLRNNPKSPVKPENLGKVDFVIVTHNHDDHLGDAFEIVKQKNAKLISIFENVMPAYDQGIPSENIAGMNIGSQVDFGKIKVALVPAVHTGNCAGVVITGDGVSIYHAGDTGIFGDMKLIGEMYHPKVSLLPTGGYFTMGPKEAAMAARMLGSQIVFPMHYGTFPPINTDPKELKDALSPEVKVPILKPGESFIV